MQLRNVISEYSYYLVIKHITQLITKNDFTVLKFPQPILTIVALQVAIVHKLLKINSLDYEIAFRVILETDYFSFLCSILTT